MARRGARRGLTALVGTFTGCGVIDGYADTEYDRVTYSKGFTSMDDYPDFTGCHSYVAQVLSPEMWQTCWKMTTPAGQSFRELIQPGVDCPSNPSNPSIGCYIGDEQGYDIFANFVNEVVRMRHPGWDTNNRATVAMQPDGLKIDRLPDEYVVACRIRGSRNFRGYRFSPTIKRGERREIETVVKLLVKELPGIMKGQYYSLSDIGLLEAESYVSTGLLFPKPSSPELVTAGVTRDWPDGRGFYKSMDQEMLIWVNENDHLRIVSHKKSGDVKGCFSKYAVACTNLEYQGRKVGKFFSHDSVFGYIGPSLANIGTAMRASLQVKLPLVSKHPGLPDFLESNNLTTTSLTAPGGIIEIANSERICKTETELINNLVLCVHQLIAYEKSLEKGKKLKQLK